MSSISRPFILLFVTVGVGCFTVAQSNSQAPTPRTSPSWEYHFYQASGISEAKLNELGEEGWELVTIYPHNRCGFRDLAVLKRPK